MGDDQVPTKLGEIAQPPYEFEYFTPGVTLADNGEYRFQTKAYDAAGNVGTSDEQQVTVAIDGTAPIVTLTAPTRLTTPGVLRFSVESNEGMPHVELFDGDLPTATKDLPAA